MDGERDVWTVHQENAGEVDKDKTWNWLVRSDLKVETWAFLCTAQEQVIRTNYIKHYIDKNIDNPHCRMCGKRGESVQHIISECKKLAQKEYKRSHDNEARKFIGNCVSKKCIRTQGKIGINITQKKLQRTNV